MLIDTARFLISSPDISKCPKHLLPEYAFIGRSNVGKSSLINMLTGRKGLAKISGTPGKTRLINYFIINDKWYLVDLPGFGYAKVSRTDREKWGKMIRQYLIRRKNLVCTFVLIDARREPQKIDNDMIDWMGINQLPFVIIFTKTDKLTRKQLSENINNFSNHLLQKWEALPQMILSSAKTKDGLDEIMDFIKVNNKIFGNQLKNKH
jgi:GTP-binding protein